MATKRKTFDASFTRTEAVRRRGKARQKGKSAPPKSNYGPLFFVIMGITVASALGFLGVVASVLAGS